MPEFFNVLPPGQALRVLLDRLEPQIEAENVAAYESLGRVTAAEVLSAADLPAFQRSTMDGYSVRSADTFGATESLPAFLDVVGDVAMGAKPSVTLDAGQAARAYTGGMLAVGADAVVMVEHTQPIDDRSIEVLRPAAPGENVNQVGEDIRAGDVVFHPGHEVRPQDVGGLMALGVDRVTVARRPRVAVVSTGDELVPPESTPAPGQVRDVNTYTLSALIERAGGVPVRVGLLPDDFEEQRTAAVEGLARSDMLIFSAGSSVSVRDMTAQVFASVGEPGVLVHGISFKPGKPTILALLDGKPAIGLPGNPVSAAVVFDMIAAPVVRALMGGTPAKWRPSVRAALARDVPSQTGRQDTVQVSLDELDGVVTAEPVFGSSNLVYTMVRADGHVTVPIDRGGLYAGQEVEVTLY